MSQAAMARERRVTRRLEARGMRGLGQALVGLRGTTFGARWELGSLFAVGAEGAVYLCRDLGDPAAPTRVAKVALLPYHKPFDLSFDEVRRRRGLLRDEAARLEKSAGKYMPEFLGLHEFANPLLDAERGDEFAASEPVYVMEKLPGFDLDFWLARVHGSSVPRRIVRRHVDHVTIVVLRALWDLHERGFFYCDLRPGNVRIRGRSEHRVRLMDAGSLVPVGDTSGCFPHVPAYLPPDLFWRAEELGPEVLVPTLRIQTIMAGRTLFEVATGRVPVPGEEVDPTLLHCDTVSPDVADTIQGLCAGEFDDVFQALKFLAERAGKKKTPAVRASAASASGTRTSVRRGAAPAPSPVDMEPTIANAGRDLASALAAARATFKPLAARHVAPKPITVAVLEPEPDSQPAAVPERRPAPAPAAGPATGEFADFSAQGVGDDILPPSAPRPAPWWRRALDFLRRR